jgi:hypothetical protein
VRPNVSEQLDGIRHVLAEVIAPHVTDPYAANILGGLLGALGSLAAGWSEVPQFLLWDAAGTVAVLTAARPYLDEGLTAELDEVLGYALAGDIDLQALEIHHRRVRALLELAVPAMVDQPAVRSLLVGHLRDRIAHFPLAAVPPIRQPQTGGMSADAAR